MASPTVLVSTWSDGVFVCAGAARNHELVGHSIRGLTSDGGGGALAIVDGHTVRRRADDGSWSTLATTATADADLSCLVAVDELMYLGTDDARILRLDANGAITDLSGFGSVVGRERWYAGQALVDGRMLGPPLGVRSITATVDGTAILANVHVGGIPRSTDGGATWHPTIDVESDVHEVRAHPRRPEIVIAAAGVGLCLSRDGGATWVVQHEGLHASHCSAVAFAGDDVLVSASEDPFAPLGAVYRRPVDGPRRLEALGDGFPEWTEGRADTGCIGTTGPTAAIADAKGNVYLSTDAGRRWTRYLTGIPGPSGVLIV